MLRNRICATDSIGPKDRTRLRQPANLACPEAGQRNMDRGPR